MTDRVNEMDSARHLLLVMYFVRFPHTCSTIGRRLLMCSRLCRKPASDTCISTKTKTETDLYRSLFIRPPRRYLPDAPRQNAQASWCHYPTPQSVRLILVVGTRFPLKVITLTGREDRTASADDPRLSEITSGVELTVIYSPLLTVLLLFEIRTLE